MENKTLPLVIIIIFLITTVFIWRSTKKRSQPVKIQNNLIVGTNAEYPPYTFIEKDEIVGFDIDIAREVAKRLNKKIEIRDMSWQTLVPALQLGEIDMIAAGMSPTPERAKRISFTKPYISGDQLLIVTLAKNTPLRSVDELKGKKVIVNEGYTADQYMSNIQDIELLKLPSPTEGFMALQSGRANAYVIANSSAQRIFKKYGLDTFSFAAIEGTGESYSLAVSKENTTLLDQVQKTLDAMEKDGTIQEIRQTWNL